MAPTIEISPLGWETRMKIYKLQKYNPKYYSSDNVYMADEWIHVSQIGEHYGGRKFTTSEYVEMENRYIQAIEELSQFLQVDEFTVFSDGYGIEDTENFESYLFGMNRKKVRTFKNLERISGDEIALFSRLCLRDLQGNSISNGKDLFFCFTGDYYVHVGCHQIPRNLIKKIEDTGVYLIFVGQIGSPQIDSEYYQGLIF